MLTCIGSSGLRDRRLALAGLRAAAGRLVPVGAFGVDQRGGGGGDEGEERDHQRPDKRVIERVCNPSVDPDSLGGRNWGQEPAHGGAERGEGVCPFVLEDDREQGGAERAADLSQGVESGGGPVHLC